ncbi:MAG: DUF1152 domain-containing protein [Actinobacteria bacterium]|nr:DUF1152 domain-containing protein [Actinomycetota bacterium]
MMLEEAARRSRSAVVIGNGGGGDCLVGVLVGHWLRTIGVDRVLHGGIACQWWPEPGTESDPMVHVLGPDLYDPAELEGARPLGEHAVLVGPEARSAGRVPHEAVLAEGTGGLSFVLSLLGGGRGAVEGLAAVVAHAEADLVVSVDVGSDCLSTGDEVRPTMTVLADHLTLCGLLGQDVAAYFCLAGYGVDAEMELEELDRNFGEVVRAGGLRGGFVASPEAVALLERLQGKAFDPVGNLVVEANRGRFGLHRVHTGGPWGNVARITPATLPVWALDPQVVASAVARDVNRIVDTESLEEAERIYVELGRLPETRIARTADFRRRAPS